MRTILSGSSTLVLLAVAAWLAGAQSPPEPAPPKWQEVVPGVWRSAGIPCGYALVSDKAALLVGAPRRADLDALKSLGVERFEFCLLTHHHRDTSARAAEWVRAGIPVRAPRASAEWLTPAGVAQFWRTSLPEVVPGKEPGLRDRTFGIWAFQVHALGIEGLDCSLEDRAELEWRGWKLQAIATPGHSRDHMAFAAHRANADTGPLIFCGDALAARGKIWSPYTTDWDHWTDTGLKAAAESLRKLAELQPSALFPEHGPALTNDPVGALRETADKLAEVGFLKSFERYSKERVGQPPSYAFLAPDQVATAGEKPWTRISEHLFLTGNTYAVASADGPVLVLDPFGSKIAEHIRTLHSQYGLGPVERVLISHAHNDHYTGIFQLPNRPDFEVWTLDRVAQPLNAPFYFCAPYVDARSVKIDRLLRDGETVRWREYELRIGHLPGQTDFTMGVQTTIDGKRCYFTADNFFHADQFSGSGGWSGRNRSWPSFYAASAKQVLDAAPEWVLAEHGGGFEFSAEDFKRRVQWGLAAATAADAVCITGSHRDDWNPARIRVEPLLLSGTPGATVQAALVVDGASKGSAQQWAGQIQARGLATADNLQLAETPGETTRVEFAVRIAAECPAGRHIIPVVVQDSGIEAPADVFFILEVETPIPAAGRP